MKKLIIRYAEKLFSNMITITNRSELDIECEDIINQHICDECIKICHVKINNLDAIIQLIVNTIVDLNWINKLPAHEHKGIKAAAQPTINYIKSLCTKLKTSNSQKRVKKDFGEYAVSICALKSLTQIYNHEALPLLEILKEKVIGNPGFDYATIKDGALFIFGEAKYRNDGSGDKVALKQIADFISNNKHYIESNNLDKFNLFAANQCSNGMFGVSFASNLGRRERDKKISNIADDDRLKKLAETAQIIYIIYIENEGFF